MKLKIKVTKEILKQSMMCGFNKMCDVDPFNCAIALAVREIWPNAYVDCECIEVNGFLTTTIATPSIKLPNNANEFVVEFDRLTSSKEERLLMPEIEFEVEIDPDIHLKHIEGDVKNLINNSLTLEIA